ncbi:MAG: transcription termination factor Rho, partial [Halobacteriovoraceae bacterium]|nr:transcription termination factor Rho [Halobacteriovoraceae bacterium]
MHLNDLREMEINELTKLAGTLDIENPGAMKRHEVIFAILKTKAKKEEEIFGGGVLEILPDGFGFLRSPGYNYLPGADDIYVS